MATASSCPDAIKPFNGRSAVMPSPNALLPRQRQPAPAARYRLAQELRHRIDCVKMWRWDIDEARKFDDRAEHRVDLGRAAMLDVLQHRSLVRADAFGAGDP